MRRVSCTLLLLVAPAVAFADPLVMTARYRSTNPADLGGFEVREEKLRWEPKQTAIIICDMWDRHWCSGATQRVAELAPRINQLIGEARSRGVFIIHAPSDCMDYYKGTLQRQRAQSAPEAKNQPKEIANWCRQIPGEPALPVDDSDGGCDESPADKSHRAWTREHQAIQVADDDAVSDSGKEIWNLLEARGISNVLVMGVHTNMCVLGRPFGLRQMARNGKNVVLVRDLTDSMYNPRKSPFVSHRRGTELIIEHIEKFVCPSVVSADLLGGAAPSNVVFVIGEEEYHTSETLARFAKDELEKHHIHCTFVLADDKHDKNRFPGIEALRHADLMVLSVRRRILPADQLAIVHEHLESGRPLVGIRTASHAFALPNKSEGWPTFDKEVLGGDYQMHYSNSPEKGPLTFVTRIEHAEKRPVLNGVAAEFSSKGSLYRNKTLAKSATPLLRGRIGPDGSEREFVAWTNTYKGGRVFYTSLGYMDDFQNESFRRLLLNGMLWAMEREVPAAAKDADHK
jgi:nicotinamidase-related amidase/type 1 glutamine amidotransferase